MYLAQIIWKSSCFTKCCFASLSPKHLKEQCVQKTSYKALTQWYWVTCILQSLASWKPGLVSNHGRLSLKVLLHQGWEEADVWGCSQETDPGIVLYWVEEEANFWDTPTRRYSPPRLRRGQCPRLQPRRRLQVFSSDPWGFGQEADSGIL